MSNKSIDDDSTINVSFPTIPLTLQSYHVPNHILTGIIFLQLRKNNHQKIIADITYFLYNFLKKLPCFYVERCKIYNDSLYSAY